MITKHLALATDKIIGIGEPEDKKLKTVVIACVL